MNGESDELYQHAMRLSADQRRDLTYRLWDVVEGEFAPDVDAAWAEEITRRVGEIDRGAVDMIPGEEVARRVREHIQRTQRDPGS